MKATIQLCTFNRARVLERVLDACFEQTVSASDYEVVLVNDGSSDDTPATIARAQARATCAFTVVNQPNGGLAKARNAGLARSTGERVILIDDDVLPLPNFVEEHLRSHAAHPKAIVRGAAITVDNLDDLPPPIWSLRDYSGNYFWTTNVSVPLATLRAVGGFNESFAEYGWEDIDVGLRLRFAGVKAVFNRHALVYHYKPRPRPGDVEKMLRQARAQARTAVQLAQLHPHWRTYLATGDNPVQRLLHKWMRGIGAARHFQSRISSVESDRPLTKSDLRAAQRLAAEEYFAELERARQAAR
ncbi:MAG TPA: glycosyltransferase family A protein [Candidatus Rubrimentiphilum sp.]|nr:glycosyltransferase family A protein [Candidatus Rubrimentiphilum sp.]